jgi:hypothetical protein
VRRYQLRLDGRRVATVWLDPERTRRVTARLGPLPAFRRISRLFDDLAAARATIEADGVTAAPEAVLADEERALAELSRLDLSLADDATGAAIATQAIKVLPGKPPRVRVDW